ncbi:MAG: YbgC/FadM family acyl-CoA thioesterase [Nitrospirota bacterium]|nr:YbgC/FadM family acyl-CoA thioesterase [Nitrospirota bacterium]
MNPLKIKIYYEDTDAGSVVYYANYLRYLERARTEFLLDKGIDVAEYHNNGYLFAVIHVDADYKRPARLGEIIEVTTEIIEITNATINLKHQILRNSTLLVEANVRVACIDKDGKPRRIPDSFKNAINVK